MLAEAVGNATSPTQRAETIRTYAARFGVSLATARRHAGIRLRPRRDREPRYPVAREVLDQVVALWLSTRTEKYPSATASLADVIDRAVIAGILERGAVSVGQLRRYIAREHITLGEQRRQAPHVWLRSEHPNHVHQLDVSRCRQWYLRPDGRLDVQSFTKGTAEYRNKDLRDGVPILRYVLVDHASGLPYVQYAADETAPTLLSFAAGAWFPKRQRREVGPTNVERWWPAPFDPERYDEWGALPLLRDYPFRGVSRMLVLDRASANQSQFTGKLCERLGIELIEAQKARAKGSVERMMWIWETKFEAWLHAQPAPDLHTLNVWALDFLARWCLKAVHSRHGMTRTQAWALIEREQLRELAGGWPVFRELATREPEARLVVSGDPGCGQVRHGGHTWRIADAALIGQTVQVWYTAFDQDELLARTADDRVFHLERIERDRFGFSERAVTFGTHARHPDSATEKTEKRLAAVRAALPPREFYGRDGEQHDTPAFLGPRQGVEIPITLNLGARELTRKQWNARAIAELAALSEPEGAERDERWAGHRALPESTVDDFVAWCLARRAQPGVDGRKVVPLFQSA